MHIKHNRAALVIYVDDVAKDLIYGDHDWTIYKIDLPAGKHTIKWCYLTAQSGSVEEYVCWIDDVKFPGNTMILNVEDVVEDNVVMIYPNPANDVINVKGEDLQYVEIYNSIGQKIVSRKINDSESINIADFASGIYFVRILDKKGNISTTKIVKR